ncbi:transcription factor bHLH143-like [Rutidosis leptorrhynchoides]|uniref:transcription factor bHLH143-like n=1 Tax=Rutidosis leptorrhynchoides TaxID=125765 RepID=UPI003A99930B
MEKGFESWFQNQQIDPNLSCAPFGFRHRLNVPSLGNTLSPNLTNGNPPMFTFAAAKPQESRGWFKVKDMTRVVNSFPKQQYLEPRTTHKVQKKFLVFDRSNDCTTMIYTSTPTHYHLPKPHISFDPKKETSVKEKHEGTPFFNTFVDDGNNETSEMHEDTEELNALLYSDDDEFDYSEDDEEESTAHSPNTVIDSKKHEQRNENFLEEVASSNGGLKRRKLETRGYDVSFEDTASSGVNCSGDDSDAGNGFPEMESESLPERKKRVKETISILKELIPGAKSGKDAMMLIDEAISYLKILKVKAKALGIDSL